MAHSTQSELSELSLHGRARLHPGLAWFWQILYILYCLEVGVFLLFLPWMNIWDNNYFLYLYPKLRPVVANSYLRGAVLGLGVINLLIGIQEIVHFRKGSRSRSFH